LQLDDNFKRLVNQLGDAINDSLADSKKIAEIIEEIRESGYDLFLVLEVTIGFNKRGEEKAVHRRKFAASQSHEAEFHLTTQDTQFLRSLKIRVEEDRK
jgi:predicted deacetylase